MAPVTDFERLGSSYLGRRLRADGSVGPEPLLYDAEDPTTHAVCVGMTGSERADPEALQERIASAVSGILVLLGIEADPLQSREHILLANVLEPLVLRWSAEAGLVSRPREDVGAFRVRVRAALREQRDAALETLRARYHPKLARAARGATRVAREHGDAERTREEHAAAEAELRELDAAFRTDAAALRDARAESEPAEPRLRARKSDLAVERVALVWRPYSVDAEGRAQPAFATPA